MVELERLYADYKPLLFSLAYRLLGSVSDAEDMVQDTFVAARTAELARGGQHVDNWKAYLCRTVTNRCLDLLKSARRKRERYVGPWLPEPIVQSLGAAEGGAGGGDPLEATLLGETVSYAFLVLLSRLTPVERAVFVLREAFDYSYREIAEMLGKTELGCRQTYSRVRRKIQAEPGGGNPRPSAETESIVRRFLQAAATGDMQGLIGMLAEEATLVTDGGGKLRAALHPIVGRKRVAAFLAGVAAKMAAQTEVRAVTVNGAAGLLIVAPDGPTVTAFEPDPDGRCLRIYMVRNPDKLTTLRDGM